MEIFIHLPTILKALDRASLSSRERRHAKAVFSSRETNRRKVSLTLLLLQERGLTLSSILGFPLGKQMVHFSREFIRFRHILGLSDAIHLTMVNLGVKVSFSTPVILRRDPSQKGSRRFYFSLKHEAIRQLGYRSMTADPQYRILLHLMRVFPTGWEEKNYVKLIKYSLVDLFARQADQERPEPDFEPLSLFPAFTQRKLDNKFRYDRKGRVRFYKNLLESKTLCAPVGDDMIREAYEKHKASLCRPQEDVLNVPHEFLRELYEYGVRVGREISHYYDPDRTSLPNTRASIEAARHQGGARSYLSGHLEVQRGPLYLQELDSATRPEPYVIGLFGPPGSGKTTSVQRLVRSLGISLFPEKKDHELSYSRSCSMKHWDGYNGQPIVVLDDFGQDLLDRSDLVEFEQLVSVNPYVLPMAHLENKGMRFISPILIVTSNCGYGNRLLSGDLKTRVVEDEVAVWRRFHLPLLVEREPSPSGYSRSTFRRYLRERMFLSREGHWSLKYRSQRDAGHAHDLWSLIPTGQEGQWLGAEEDIQSVVVSSIKGFRMHTDFHMKELSTFWRQDVACFNLNVSQGEVPPFYNVRAERVRTAYRDSDVTVSQLYPRFPPHNRPVVEAVAIPEPLKVRMITKAEADTKVLQPFQKALFRYLGSKPQFTLTHGVPPKDVFSRKLEWIYRIEGEIRRILDENPGEDLLWLSGDYTAATDNFPMSVTTALIEGILSEIDHEPTKSWVRYECSSHTIRYPDSIGVQTSGQLMGSLISFPLLCFLNDFIVSRSGFKPGSYLINGDDVVARGLPASIQQWRTDAPKVGLSLSLGKNFIDPDFCCINSQLFWRGDVQHTGKVSLQTRHGKSLGFCFSESQFYYGFDPSVEREFIRRNLVELRKTPRSLKVAVGLGGLGLINRFDESVDPERCKDVYLHDYLRPYLKSLPVPGYDYMRAFLVPTSFIEKEELDAVGEDGKDRSVSMYELLKSLDTNPADPPDSTDLSFSQLIKTRTFLKENYPSSRNKIIARRLESFPKLGTLRNRLVYVPKGRVGFLKERVVQYCLDLLIREIDQTDRLSSEWSEEVQLERSTFDDLFDWNFDQLKGDESDLEILYGLDLTEQREQERVYGSLLPDVGKSIQLRESYWAPVDDDFLSLVKEDDPPVAPDQGHGCCPSLLSPDMA
ncbi:RNA-dependent RNA polymerase [Beihai narna-like virus 19]|uniref:RNA-dependent RNA polymerase n=1 Tax=Beihai narna-like virus 19 TaxID=1922446 RepID=UPI000909D366|nr:RNA-dependent RNA polymerase [Beihai narna-like virus 19]APG77010.1 RNA-dependent RNA polymerase [Beihai narna-like virus 19]